ncbi:tripartite tricarboxylate transporter substrate binding protein [Pseudorhodoferax sp. Leaf274]|uniref:Bug family tripartite tricarboxylate transporter substrate binding protein n=1 Tax=Pseudorhodoferax sp. Leaf274 TaxID=1736318 RepID=UPI000702AD74|nr:tripartite tricarboxylate transporter substrate binding protein [Pseudorhodoferax sp. Leaf274]KQP37513.1 ABC transporter substrate-binding protein [Pseudorhodoferax sp. Leaf274]
MRQAQFPSRTTRRAALHLALALACAAAVPAHAQDAAWPHKPIRMIVPFPAGSFTDTVARVVSDTLSRSLGQPVVVENKVGANGVIGVSEAARAAPDGYTLLLTNSSSITINPQLYRKLSYKTADLAPVTMVLEAPFILTVNPEWAQKNGIATVGDIVQFSRRNPGAVSYGSPGAGNIAHLSYAMLSNRTKISTTHVPYKSTAQAQLATIAGELNSAFDVLTAVPHIQAGKLKALAVTSPQRLAQLPDVPTMEQAGIADFNVAFWIGLLAPAGTPPQIVAKLNNAAQGLLADAKAKAALGAQGELTMRDPATFAKRIAAEVPAWGAVIQAEGIALD